MIVLQIIEMERHSSKSPVTYIDVAEEFHSLAREIDGCRLQSKLKWDAVETLFRMIDHKNGICVPPQLGKVIPSPVGCSEFYVFFYD